MKRLITVLMHHRSSVRRGIGIALAVFALLPVSSVRADPTPSCGTGEARSIAQAQATGFFQVFKAFENDRPNGGLGESVESCSFRLFLDGAVFEFAAGESVWAGYTLLESHADVTRDEYLALLSLGSESTTITDLGTGSTWQVDLEGSAVRSALHPALGAVWVQERGVELLLQAGEYEVRTVFTFDGFSFAVATVKVIIS